MTCECCSNELEFDAGTPFCDPCWVNAMQNKDEDTASCMLKWIARV